MITRATTALAILMTLSGQAFARECPDQASADAAARRQEAKQWFSEGAARAQAGDDVAALKAYQCSLKLVPHGFTAFNIGRLAERIGDLELAVASYNEYLLLVPDAPDEADITRRIRTLEERLAMAKGQAPVVTDSLAPTPPPAPAPPALGASGAGAAASAGPPTNSAAEPVGTIATGGQPRNYRTLAWVSYGGAAALLVAALVTNLMARSEMDSCRSTYSNAGRAAAQASCDDAKPLAYSSYPLFGLAGAAAAAGTFFVLRPTPSTEVALAPMPDRGLALRLGGRM